MSLQEHSSALRERLIAEVDQFLDAFAAHDARKLRIAPNLRFTENTRELPLGTGVWRTIRTRPSNGHYFVHPERGQVEYWGVIDEMGAEAIYGVRLRVDGRLISEIETLVIRGTGSFFAPSVVGQPYPPFHEILVPSERVPAAELVRIANAYFDAIELSDGSRLPVREDCRRLVNGVIDSRMSPEGLDPLEAHRALSVREQMDAGHYAYIESLRARRFPIVDEARGLVLAHVMFDHPGDLARADGEVPFRSPNSMLAFEAFKIRGGILEEVWAIGTALPYGIDSGWPL